MAFYFKLEIILKSQEYSVKVTDLTKIFEVPERDAGLKAAVVSLFKRKKRLVHAVDGILINIEPGEVVGFLGPNGAGKTTSLKMMSGLLYPTSGEVRILGYTPEKRQKEFLRQITLVMGNRNQLIWDIPAIDSFELNRAIYGIEKQAYLEIRDQMIDLMDLGKIIHKPVRNLSLGERMKVEIVASLLHKPKVLFLDEPTIGLDVSMQKRIRSFLKEYNQKNEATILLTSHYMADVQALCKRIIVIHHGKILFDGELSALVEKFSALKTLVVTLSEENGDLSRFGEVIVNEGNRVTLRVSKADAPRVTAKMLADLPITDLTIEDPPIEDVIESVFAGELSDA